jgi:hypothetical protein
MSGQIAVQVPQLKHSKVVSTPKRSNCSGNSRSTKAITLPPSMEKMGVHYCPLTIFLARSIRQAVAKIAPVLISFKDFSILFQGGDKP